MARRLKPGLFSLQTQLVISMTALILLGVVATGIVFVLRSKGEHEQQALERVAAAAPGFFQAAAAPYEVSVEGQGPVPAPGAGFVDFIDSKAAKRGLRVLLVGSEGEVVHDSAGSLEGTKVDYPVAETVDQERGYVAWEPGARASDFTFVASAGPANGDYAARPSPFAIPIGADGRPVPFGVVLGVPTSEIENAWLSALPGVGIAAGIVTPFAVALAVLLARQIARPVHQLTAASEAMARGDFDQRVEIEREDEVGRLAKAFSVMAERVGERDSQMRALIANVSHDLKTPMTSIIGYAQALRDGVADDTKRAAETIQRQANLAHELLADLLFLSEIDSGQTVPVKAPAQVSDVVEAAVSRIRPAADAKGVELAIDVDREAVFAGIDSERIVRALTNVLDNAVRFSPGGEMVRVAGRREGEQIRLEIENRGPPISEEDLPHVFERFYRVDGRADGQAGGHGLGLAIARESIELNGGSIAIENTDAGVKVRMRFAAV